MGEHSIVFYAGDSCISGFNSIWIHTTLTMVVIVFERVGLQTNLGKTKEMVCTLGLIWGKHGVSMYKWRATGGVDLRERKKIRVSCEECVTIMSASSLRHHMECTHGIVIPNNWGTEVSRGGL